ncbi:DNA helicase-2/ATP-dependent DNA helicase PcrA [Aquimarina sp. MAR_2010_214]|uniref:UvrD-helicase domain-containing protein n=1 Tax=Aquimarina sp. MAR_2010_214 TaxID=1250026 RepID=UPI000C712F3D|nr:UvrD-helicase domain-containing protein [Aquimarina sp. MAR_2010_214]PKV50847.1 DNA helicase-2/ATP-dependent DNA helicase PcrA [Aquimarina sp. MAR_2010_214]
MTSRLGKPDTPADITLRNRLEENGTRHFIMIAGAGSGKTTSLIKALNYLKQSRGNQMHQSGQKVACITYTEVAVDEISGDVGHDPLFHVSTIHSFLWSIIKPFQSDLYDWVRNRLLEKINEAQAKIDKPRTRETTRVKERENIARYQVQLEEIKSVEHFTYSTGSDYAKGILGHSDILKLGPSLIREYPLMRTVVAQRFPVIFVDESQDTIADFVDSLKVLAANVSQEFCLGFFGDPLQKIYMTGIGDITSDDNWEVIKKPENFRCPISVLNVINKIRFEADGLHQTRGRMVDVNGELVSVQGTARLFILPADGLRAQRLQGVREWLSQENEDPLWLSDEDIGDVRMLVIVHRIAASRLGFPNLYSSLNDGAPDNLSTGVIDGSAWIVRPFLRYILPLIHASRRKDEFQVIKLLRQYCPRLDPERLIAQQDIATELALLETYITEMDEMLADGNNVNIGDMVTFLAANELAELDERFNAVIESYALGIPVPENTIENSPLRFMQCQAMELWGYQKYIEIQSPFSTQQGIKGAEFDRVLVVIDDEESTANSFSYGKYLGLTPLSDTDRENIDNGRDSVVDRTRRLFYVCCSRAVKDLAVVIFCDDVNSTYRIVSEKGYFELGDIHRLGI